MAGELVAAIAAGHDLLNTITDFRGKPDYPPDKPGPYPMKVIRPASGPWQKEASEQLRGIHTLVVGAYVPRRDLARDVETVLPLGEKIRDVLALDENATWNGTISTIVWPINYTFGPVDYGGFELIGWTIDVPVLIRSAESGGAYTKI